MARKKVVAPRVYFVQEELTGRVKIGWTTDFKQRVTGFRTDCPGPVVLLGTIPGDRAVERRMHDHFADFRRHGEWFEGSDALLRAIAQILMAEGKARLVVEELARRNHCRYGLHGICVYLLGDPGNLWRVASDVWGPSRNLLLSLVPDEHWEEYQQTHAGDIVERGVPAERCVLASDWPAPCPCWR